MLKQFPLYLLAMAGLTLAGAGSAWALGGCVVSPENPTAVLGLLGAAAAAAPWLRTQIKSRFDRKKSDNQESV